MDVDAFLPMAFAALVLFLPVVILIFFYRANVRRQRQLKETALRLGLEFQDALAKWSSDAVSSTAAPGSGRSGMEAGALKRLLRPESFLGRLVQTLAPWQIRGLYRKVTVLIEPISRGSGKSKSYYTRVAAFYKQPLELGLTVTSEGFLDRLSRKLQGKNDIEIGEPDLDGRIQIQSVDAQRARSLLQDRPLREAFLALLDRYAFAELHDDRAQAELKGTVTEEARLRELLEALVQVAERMEQQGRF